MTKYYDHSYDACFQNTGFSRWLRKTELTDKALCNAVKEMSAGNIGVELGGGLVKKRIGLAGRGKRGGARTIIAKTKRINGFSLLGLKRMTVPR